MTVTSILPLYAIFKNRSRVIPNTPYYSILKRLENSTSHSWTFISSCDVEVETERNRAGNNGVIFTKTSARMPSLNQEPSVSLSSASPGVGSGLAHLSYLNTRRNLNPSRFNMEHMECALLSFSPAQLLYQWLYTHILKSSFLLFLFLLSSARS